MFGVETSLKEKNVGHHCREIMHVALNVVAMLTQTSGKKKRHLCAQFVVGKLHQAASQNSVLSAEGSSSQVNMSAFSII